MGAFFNGVFLIFTAVTAARAGVLLSDRFQYPDGPLVNVSAGRWKTHSGTAGQAEVSSGELKLSQRKSEDVSAAVEGAPLGPEETAALYASFKFKFVELPSGAQGGYFAHFKDARPTTGLRCRIFASTNGALAGTYRLGISSGSNSATALLARDLRLHTSYRAVCRLTLANGLSTLWLNPNSENDPCATSTDEAPPKTVSAFAFRQSRSSGSGMGELTVDDLVVSTAFMDTRIASLPMDLAISCAPPWSVQLSWRASPDQTYSVLAGDTVTAGFLVLATGLLFPEGAGWFEESWLAGAGRFYQICSP